MRLGKEKKKKKMAEATCLGKKKIGRGNVQMHMVNFCPLSSHIFSFQFSFHFRKKTFCCTQRENIRTPSFIFLLLHLTKHTSKKFFFLFSLQSFPFILFHFQINTLLDRFIYNEVGYELILKEHSTLISGKEKDLTNWP